jgi:predicted metal-dependent HD superfamily phosphohydrolase
MSSSEPDTASWLTARWRTLTAGLGWLPAAAEELRERLFAHYRAPERRYHTLDHVAALLRLLEPHLPETRYPDALLLAVWFHDAVYDTHAADNEQRSALLARQELTSLGVSAEMIEETARLILLTRTHDGADDDTDGLLLLDADLAILGEPQEVYERYTRAIREEYAWLPEEQYRAGRAGVLETFLRRPRIYRTASFAVREQQARRNIDRELRGLRETPRVG